MVDWSLVISVFGAVAGLLGTVAGGYSIRHNRFTAVYQFMSALEAPEMIAARKHVYNNAGSLQIDDEQASLVVNFYHHWGLMVRLHYLPRRIFNYGLGPGAVRLYECTKKYIESRQFKHDDDTYAANYEWLYRYLQKRYARSPKNRPLADEKIKEMRSHHEDPQGKAAP